MQTFRLFLLNPFIIILNYLIFLFHFIYSFLKSVNLNTGYINKSINYINVYFQGLYRVNYDSHTWHHIAELLNGNRREEIHYLNRAKVINISMDNL